MSNSRFKFYVIFIDDFTKYTWLFPIAHKSDVFDTFRLFKLQIENHLSLKIKTFRSDGGGEFMSSRFQKLLSEMEFCISSQVLSHLSRVIVPNVNIDISLRLVSPPIHYTYALQFLA